MKRLKAIACSRAFKLAVAGVLLVGLYYAADWREVGRALAGLDWRWLAAALALFVPQTWLSAVRWRAIVAGLSSISIAEATRHTLASSALNLVAPSKLGDLSKAAMLPGLSPAARASAVALVVLEKMADVAALAGLCLVGVVGLPVAYVAAAWLVLVLLALVLRPLVVPPSGGISHLKTGLRAPVTRRVLVLGAMSLPLWGLHLIQIDFFLKSAGVFVPWQTTLARVPLAIFAGLLPVSFCGVGTRDSALIWLFSDVAPASTLAAVGLLTALRYLIPGAVGIPLLARSWGRPQPDALPRTA